MATAASALGELAARSGAMVRQEQQRPACGSGSSNRQYNTSIHVIALIVVLVQSTLACSFPLLARRFPQLHIPSHFLFLSRHFGTGVLVATAFVHLLPTAFTSLTDPCLPPFWNKTYPAMAGFIAMMSVLLVVVVEMVFTGATGEGTHVHDFGEWDGVVGGEDSHEMSPSMELRRSGKRGRHGHSMSREASARGDSEQARPLNGNLSSNLEDEEDLTSASFAPKILDRENDDPSDSDSEASLLQQPSQQQGTSRRRPSHHNRSSSAAVQSDAPLTPAEMQEQHKKLLQCLLLEAGILFHSVFIGMALSVAVGTPFVVLFIAILFHQTFEGLALGSRIASIHPSVLPLSSLKPWLMALAYGGTTPIGQFIGLVTHSLYDPQSEVGLLMVGIMNAISSGLLVFAGLVDLLAQDFLSVESFEILRGKRRWEAVGSVGAGAALMALVGAFA